jgi:phosphoribosylamine--glycine ligase
MKDVVTAAGVPTARYGSFSDVDEALKFLRTMAPPYVVKTDGLAAGKGVLVTESLLAAETDVRQKLDGSAFGAAGTHVVIEEFLSGDELSILFVCNGTDAVALEPARDHKRVGDNDTGLNTGGMGAYSPVPGITKEFVAEINANFVKPTLDELRRRGIDFRGVLYAGLVLTPGGPKLLEYNVRFGDPEAQVVLTRITSDLGELLLAAANGQPLPPPTFTKSSAVGVVMASGGYPGHVGGGQPISGVEDVDHMADVSVFHAATQLVDGQLYSNGGRVLCVTALAEDLAAARLKAYEAVGKIHWIGEHHRSDLGEDAAKQENA